MRPILMGMLLVWVSAAAAEESKRAKVSDKGQEQTLATSMEKSPDDVVRERLAETVRRMEQMDKEFKERGVVEKRREEKTSERAAKSERAESKSKSKAKDKDKDTDTGTDKDSRRVYVDPDSERGRARVSYGGHAVREGGWTEIGGVTSSSRSSESSIGGYRNESSRSSSSISVRATIIRLGGPED